jgi:hypothetical protein
MTVTKCAECPLLIPNYSRGWSDCHNPSDKNGKYLLQKLPANNHIPLKCPIAQGKPFIISFTPINDENEKDKLVQKEKE